MPSELTVMLLAPVISGPVSEIDLRAFSIELLVYLTSDDLFRLLRLQILMLLHLSGLVSHL